jgi:tetratricopeptide (TPR) repeat protein
LAAQAVAALPRSALAHQAQAMVLHAQNRFEEAIHAYDAVLTLNRNFVPAYANIAYAKLSAGSTQDAIPLLEEAIRLSPRNSAVASWYLAIGQAQLTEARVDQAVFGLEEARGTNPGMGPRPHAWLASAYALEGESELAAAELTEARRQSSDGRYSSISRLRALATPWPVLYSKLLSMPGYARRGCRRNDCAGPTHPFLVSCSPPGRGGTASG